MAVKEEFHPKRNQARQKLATLPVGRFKDLASDVYSELARRYTSFTENAVSIEGLYNNIRYIEPLFRLGTGNFTSYSSNPSYFLHPTQSVHKHHTRQGHD